MSEMGLPPLGLYIHIPWCLKKCPYCDFNSHAFKGELPEHDYCDQLIEDLKQDLKYVQGRKLSSIFIGGGTPSLFRPDSIGKILHNINSEIPFDRQVEITLEANPGTFETIKFSRFREVGVNRLSIGIQSFNPRFLSALGRVHGEKEARDAAANAVNAGFDNYNLDLMFGLPGQSQEQAMNDLETALASNPPHISWYQLTVEPNTVFYSKPPVLPEHDAIADIQEAGIALLNSHGIERYEVSAYSKTGQHSSHNLNYWQFGDYLGIGAGAHGKITLPEENTIMRTRKTRQPSAYLATQNSFTVEHSPIRQDDLPLEFLMNALRLINGCKEALFEARTGIPIQRVEKQLAELRQHNLLQKDKLAATPKGFLFLDSILELFLSRSGERPGRIAVHADLCSQQTCESIESVKTLFDSHSC